MTREERNNKLKYFIACTKCEVSGKCCDEENCPIQYNAGNIGEIIENLEEISKILEQEPCEDVMAIHTQGLDEGIRCAMCTNSMKSNRGCDGGCVVNEGMYREVMNTIEKHIVPSVTPTPKKCHNENKDYDDCDQFVCSNCGIELQDWHSVERREDGDITYHEYEFHFCPNCGAKIESEDKE